MARIGLVAILLTTTATWTTLATQPGATAPAPRPAQQTSDTNIGHAVSFGLGTSDPTSGQTQVASAVTFLAP
jgi:hypothetical protein